MIIHVKRQRKPLSETIESKNGSLSFALEYHMIPCYGLVAGKTVKMMMIMRSNKHLITLCVVYSVLNREHWTLNTQSKPISKWLGSSAKNELCSHFIIFFMILFLMTVFSLVQNDENKKRFHKKWQSLPKLTCTSVEGITRYFCSRL